MRPLTKQEAQSLPLPCVAWLEETGEYEGSLYGQYVYATEQNQEENCLVFMGDFEKDCTIFLMDRGRPWDAYNRRTNGWRLWPDEPTYQEEIEAEWEVNT